MNRSARLLLCFLALLAPVHVRAQAAEGALSQQEIESLRDAAYVPIDRIQAYEKILDTRERRIDDLLAQRRHVSFGEDMHDVIDQFGNIVDELNNNLDELDTRHRDLRKILPKLIAATEKWSTALRAPSEDDAYKVVRRIALDAVKDTRDIAEKMQVSQATYFKEHPNAARAEKERLANEHAPTGDR